MTKIYLSLEDGLADIHEVRRQMSLEALPTKIHRKTIRKFGIIAEDGRKFMVAFVVTNVRKDKRHGVVGDPGTPCKWCNYQFEAMFRGWL